MLSGIIGGIKHSHHVFEGRVTIQGLHHISPECFDQIGFQGSLGGGEVRGDGGLLVEFHDSKEELVDE